MVALQEEAERQRTVLTLTADLQNESHDMRRRGVGVVSRAPLAVSIGRPAPLAGSARANDRRSSARCQRTGTSGLRFESPARSRGSRAAAPAAFKFHRGLLSIAVVFTCLAGMAAGIIASRCPHFTSLSELWRTKIGPFRWRCLKGEYWAYVQHAYFGIALAAAVLSVLSADTRR